MRAKRKVPILLRKGSCEVFWNPVPLSSAAPCKKWIIMNHL